MNIIELSKITASCQMAIKTHSYKPDGNVFAVVLHSAGSHEFYFLDDVIKLKMAKKVSGRYY